MSRCSVNDVICEKNTRSSHIHDDTKRTKKMLLAFVTFDLIGLQQSHYFIYVLLLLFF